MSSATTASRISPEWFDEVEASVTERQAPQPTATERGGPVTVFRAAELAHSSREHRSEDLLREALRRHFSYASMSSKSVGALAFHADDVVEFDWFLALTRRKRGATGILVTPPAPDAKQRAKELLRSWLSTPDDRGEAYWDEFERDVLADRLAFRDDEP